MGGEKLITALTLDVQGNPREVIDPRGNEVMRILQLEDAHQA